MAEYEQLGKYYRKLVEQIAYIKVHYSKVYHLVWINSFKMEEEIFRAELDWERTVNLGVCISETKGCYAAFCNENGDLVRVPNTAYPQEMPSFQKYQFDSCGDLRHIGIAASKLALVLKNMTSSAFLCLGVEVEKVYITCKNNLPSNESINKFINMRKRRFKKWGFDEKKDLSFIAYDEFPKTSCMAEGMIQWAGQLADIGDIEYVENVRAIVNAFENSSEKNRMKNGEIGLIYEISEENVEFILVRKEKEGEFKELASDHNYGPVTDWYYDEGELEPEEYNPHLDYVLGKILVKFMLDAGLKALGIYGDKQEDDLAFYNLENYFL